MYCRKDDIKTVPCAASCSLNGVLFLFEKKCFPAWLCGENVFQAWAHQPHASVCWQVFRHSEQSTQYYSDTIL